MKRLEFKIELSDGSVEASGFTGWQSELCLYKCTHSTAMYELTRHQRPSLCLMAFDCWPLPLERKRQIHELNYFSEVFDYGGFRITDGSFSLECSSFWLYEGDIQFTDHSQVTKWLFKPYGGPWPGEISRELRAVD